MCEMLGNARSPPRGEDTPIPRLMTRGKGNKGKLVEKWKLKTKVTKELV